MPNADDSAPWGVYPCRGGWCAIEASTDEQWQYLTVAMGHPELMAYPDYVRAELRVKNRAAVDAHVREWTETVTPPEAVRVLAAVGVPARPVDGPGEAD